MRGYIYVGSEILDKIEEITDMELIEGRKGDLIETDAFIEMVTWLIDEHEHKMYDKNEEIDNLNQQLDYAVNGY